MSMNTVQEWMSLGPLCLQHQPLLPCQTISSRSPFPCHQHFNNQFLGITELYPFLVLSYPDSCWHRITNATYSTNPHMTESSRLSPRLYMWQSWKDDTHTHTYTPLPHTQQILQIPVPSDIILVTGLLPTTTGTQMTKKITKEWFLLTSVNNPNMQTSTYEVILPPNLSKGTLWLPNGKAERAEWKRIGIQRISSPHVITTMAWWRCIRRDSRYQTVNGQLMEHKHMYMKLLWLQAWLPCHASLAKQPS